MPKVGLFLITCALATGAFWSVILTSPPKSQAATSGQNGYLTSTDWSTFNGKQAALVSGTNIKTINGSSLLGSGDLTISGGGLSSSNFVYNETPSGPIDGSNMTFTSANTITAGKFIVEKNGIVLNPNTDYSFTTSTITTNVPPLPGDSILIFYMK